MSKRSWVNANRGVLLMRGLHLRFAALLAFACGVLCVRLLTPDESPAFALRTIGVLSPAVELYATLAPGMRPAPDLHPMALATPRRQGATTAFADGRLPVGNVIEHNRMTLTVSPAGGGMVEVESDGESKPYELAGLTATLGSFFWQRLQNRAYLTAVSGRDDVAEYERIDRTVLVRVGRAHKYTEVLGLVEAVEAAGARPIGVQVADLPED